MGGLGLLPVALASVSFGFVLIRVRVRKGGVGRPPNMLYPYIGERTYYQSKSNTQGHLTSLMSYVQFIIEIRSTSISYFIKRHLIDKEMDTKIVQESRVMCKQIEDRSRVENNRSDTDLKHGESILNTANSE